MAKRDYYRCSESAERRWRRHQEGLPAPGHEVSPGPQPGQTRRRGQLQGGQGSLRGPVRQRQARGLRPLRPRRRAAAATVWAAGSAAGMRSATSSATCSATSSAAAAAAAVARFFAARICATSSTSPSSRPSAERRSISISHPGRVRALRRQRRGARLRSPSRARPAAASARCAWRRASSRIQQTCPTCGGAGTIDREALPRVLRARPGPEGQDAVRQGAAGCRQWRPDPARPRGRGRSQRRAPRRSVRRHHGGRRIRSFTREGQNLNCEVPMSFATAALGGVVDVPTLDGNVVLKVPAETQSGRVFRLRGKGVRSVRCERLRRSLLPRVGRDAGASDRRAKDEAARVRGVDSERRSRHSPRARSWFDGVQASSSNGWEPEALLNVAVLGAAGRMGRPCSPAWPRARP